MSSFNKKQQTLYAEERRKQNRLNQEKLIQTDVESELTQYLDEQNFGELENLEPFYPAVYDFIKRKAPSLNWKKYAHEFFRVYIKQRNLYRNEPLALPSLTFDMKRDQPIVTMSWMENGHYIDKIIDKLWDYWVLAKESTVFSDDEIIGNILISSILYAGLNQKASLTALLEHLKDPVKIRRINDINIIFLEPFSSAYGDLYIDEKTIRKSRNFIPDQITRLWLIHFNNRQIRNVTQTVDDYLEIIFNKIKLPFNKKNFKLLRDYSNSNWMQLTGVDIDPALAQCLIENTASCGLSEKEFERFFQPKFKYHQNQMNQNIEIKKSTYLISDQYCVDNFEIELKNITKVHKDFLKIISIKHTDTALDLLIIDYCIQNFSIFNEFTQRIALWLISLYQPSSEKIHQLSKLFKFSESQFRKSFQDNRPLAESSIYTYYTRIAEPWMTHSLQYLNTEDDVNNILNKIYEQIINNTRIAREAEQPEFKKSSSQTLNMLKRFHSFQQKVFHAEPLELVSITTQSRPRARIIGHLTFKMFIIKLDALFTNGSIDENHYKILKIIYILAYRTGMRFNEILGLRVRDIEGMTDLSIWIQPYGSKKQGNQHKLKTDSAERNIPIYILLKKEEYQLLNRYVIEQRLLNQNNLYLFHHWNESTKLNKHSVTMPFKTIMNGLFNDHDYSFHSFRHTAANHLSLILNCDYAPLVHQLTDYTEQEYQEIRAEILRNSHGQNHWFIIAHLLGHIDPSETFKSYIHLSYLIAGHKILQYHPEIDHQFAKKLMGYNPTLKFLNTTENSNKFNFKKYSADLSQTLINDQSNWLNSDIESIQNEITAMRLKPHDVFNYFAGTQESKISFEYFFNCLTLLEIRQDAQLVSQEISLPFELVKYWYENAQQLAQLKSQKKSSRLFDQKVSNALKPAMLFTKEEKSVLVYFFERIQKSFEKNPTQIQAVLETFLSRVSVTHTGLYYPRNKIDQLELFFSQVKDLFPSNYWHLLGQNLETLLDAKQQPQLFKLSKLSTANHPTTQENYVRLQLYSTKYKKALAAFKFCLHLACIGRPCKLELRILENKNLD
ncbi:hypothetical protein GCM10023206_21130 [Acinetobacter puyangensis]|uniref:Phage integrase family protein n=1 Tax=Acinetobacter puyangensis TaxID=1096779 RepID=A0A240EE88_9GAMM|nr:tyrosine-type recombinase/integrase [Acinetobacter puyangensis]SNX46583.1 Phage integrase family protein [Acinetobacter puyangensis]